MSAAHSSSETSPGGEPPAAPGLGLGSRVGGYTLEAELGTGGMGKVYLARQEGTGAQRALKVLPQAAFGDLELASRFRREAEAMGRVDGHPNLVRVFGCGEHEGHLYLVMELVAGGDLQARLAQGPLPPREAAHLTELVARALEHAHRNGVLHRDLKPGNVLLTAEGVPKVTDFGLARLSEGERLTQTGAILGSPGYMAPEQAEGSRATDERTDVYGLGALLYAALSARAPFGGEGKGLFQVLGEILNAPPPPLRAHGVAVPPALEALCLRALAKDPAGRYPSARALADDLARFQRGELRGPRPRWLAGALLAGGLGAAGLAGLAATTWLAPARSVEVNPVSEAPAAGSPSAAPVSPDDVFPELAALARGRDAVGLRAALDRLAGARPGPGSSDLEAARVRLLAELSAEVVTRLARPDAATLQRLDCLGALLYAPSPLAAPAELVAALDEAAPRLLARAQRERLRDLEEWAGFEIRRGYLLRRPIPVGEAHDTVHERLSGLLRDSRPPEEIPLDLLLLALAAGYPGFAQFNPLHLCALKPAGELAQASALRPESRALALVRACEGLTRWRWASDDEGLIRARIRDAGLATRGALADLGTRWAPEGLALEVEALGHLNDHLARRGSPPAERRGLLLQIVETSTRARAAQPPFTGNRYTYLVVSETAALRALGRPEEATQLWARRLGWEESLPEPLQLVGGSRWLACMHYAEHLILSNDRRAVAMASEAFAAADSAFCEVEARAMQARAALIPAVDDRRAAAAALGPDPLASILGAREKSGDNSRLYACFALEFALEREDLKGARALYQAAVQVHGAHPLLTQILPQLEALEREQAERAAKAEQDPR